MDVDLDVDRVRQVSQFQRLADDHPARLAGEVLADVLAVDRDAAGAALEEHAGDRRLAPTGAVMLVLDHVCLFPSKNR